MNIDEMYIEYIKAQMGLYAPFLKVYENKSYYIKSNGKWDYQKISDDVGLSIQTCRKWMKRIADNLESETKK